MLEIPPGIVGTRQRTDLCAYASEPVHTLPKNGEARQGGRPLVQGSAMRRRCQRVQKAAVLVESRGERAFDHLCNCGVTFHDLQGCLAPTGEPHRMRACLLGYEAPSSVIKTSGRVSLERVIRTPGPATARNGSPVRGSRYREVHGDTPAGASERRGSRASGSPRNRCSPPVEWSRSAAKPPCRP